MHPVSYAVRKLTLGWFRGARAELLLRRLAYVLEVDLLAAVQHGMGVNCWQNTEETGERFFAATVLPLLLEGGAATEGVLFDVGANRGQYCRMLRELFPHARIYAFEPNPDAYRELLLECAGARIESVNIALGAAEGTGTHQVPRDDPSGSHGSLHAGVFGSVHSGNRAMLLRTVRIRALKDFVLETGVGAPVFVKIDTEGHELAVLRGSGDLLRDGRIRVIQFEFNEMNVISRVFLLDFYDLLKENYEFYRLASRQLLPLGPYATRNEIFQFQNIVAVWRPLTDSPVFRAFLRM